MDRKIVIDKTTSLRYINGQWYIYYNDDTDLPLVSSIGYQFYQGSPIRAAFSFNPREDLKDMMLENYQVPKPLDDESGFPCRPSSNGFQVIIDNDDNLRFYPTLSSERCIIVKFRPISVECIGCVVLFEANHLIRLYDNSVDEIISKFELKEIKQTTSS